MQQSGYMRWIHALEIERGGEWERGIKKRARLKRRSNPTYRSFLPYGCFLPLIVGMSLSPLTSMLHLRDF